MPTPTPNLRKPTQDAVISALIAQVVAQADWIDTQLADYDSSFSVTASTTDEGEYNEVKFGDRLRLPQGWCICLIPLTPSSRYWATGDGVGGTSRDDLQILIRCYWRDESDQTVLDKPGKAWRLITAMQEILMAVFSPTALGGTAGRWQVDPEDTDTLLLNDAEPFVSPLTPFVLIGEDRKALIPACEMLFKAYRVTEGP